MTEAEWLRCSDPKPMIEFVQAGASDRKLRLFACACARQVWDRLLPGDMREAVETGERFADGLATEEERLRYVNSLYELPVAVGRRTGTNWFSSRPPEEVAAYFAVLQTVGRFGCGSITKSIKWEQASVINKGQQPDLLRDILGNPFRRVVLYPEWLTPAVIALARGMYESRDFSATPSLADALQDAGCDSDDILDHCRGPGPHVRGCWVVDLLLGKD